MSNFTSMLTVSPCCDLELKLDHGSINLGGRPITTSKAVLKSVPFGNAPGNTSAVSTAGFTVQTQTDAGTVTFSVTFDVDGKLSGCVINRGTTNATAELKVGSSSAERNVSCVGGQTTLFSFQLTPV